MDILLDIGAVFLIVMAAVFCGIPVAIAIRKIQDRRAARRFNAKHLEPWDND